MSVAKSRKWVHQNPTNQPTNQPNLLLTVAVSNSTEIVIIIVNSTCLFLALDLVEFFPVSPPKVKDIFCYK